MEDVLVGIFKFSFFICASYFLGLAARYWWEIKFLLLFVLGCIVLGMLSSAVFLNRGLSISQHIQDFMVCAMIFFPLGYTTGFSIFERFLASDEFDETYRKYAKRHKKAYDAEQSHDYDYFRPYEADSRTSYEKYSQQRRSETHSNTHTQPEQDYRSDKDKMLDILEVTDKNATAEDLKNAYRILARKYHPDLLVHTGLSEAELKVAEQRMQDINQAYDWLGDRGFV